MLENIMENIIVWVMKNIVTLLIGGAAVVFTFSNEVCLFVYFAMMITLILTGNVYLKKKGYVFVTEDEEA